jgi:hypothetical protein
MISVSLSHSLSDKTFQEKCACRITPAIAGASAKANSNQSSPYLQLYTIFWTICVHKIEIYATESPATHRRDFICPFNMRTSFSLKTTFSIARGSSKNESLTTKSEQNTEYINLHKWNVIYYRKQARLFWMIYLTQTEICFFKITEEMQREIYSSLTFRKNLQPPYSGSRSMPIKKQSAKFTLTFCLLPSLFFDLEDGGCKFLRTVVGFLRITRR